MRISNYNYMNGGTTQYTGEKMGGELRNWSLFGVDANQFVQESYGLLASRCVTLYHTSALARAAVNKPLRYAIGKGIIFKSLPDHDILGITEDEAKEFGRRFTKLMHYEKKSVNYYKKQKTIFREASIAGDSVLYFVREDNGRPFDLVVANGSAIDWTKTTDGYTLGIKHDQYGRRQGFWSETAQQYTPFRDDNNDQLAIQFMFTERAGQLRGLSKFYSEISRSKNFDRVWDAVTERTVQEAMNIGYFEGVDGADPYAQAQSMASAAAGKATSTSGTMTELDPAINSKGGNYYVFDGKGALKFTDMKSPGNNFGLMNEWTVNMFATARGIPPEVLLSKYATSFTAHKGALNDFVKLFEDERAEFIEVVDKVVNFEYLKHFVRSGQLKVVDGFWDSYVIQEAYLQGTYLAPVVGQINPLQEVSAYEKIVKNGFNLRSSVAANYGMDFDTAINTWADEQDKWYNSSPDTKAERLEAELRSKTNE